LTQAFDQANAEALVAWLAVLARAAPEGDEPILVDQLDGYLTGLRCGPIHAEPLQAMDALFGDDWPAALDAEDATEAFMDALHRRWLEIGAALEPGPLRAAPEAMRLMPLLTEFDAETQAGLVAAGVMTPDQADALPPSGLLWCEGFLRAVRDHDADWHSFAAGSEAAAELDAMLLAVTAVTLPAGTRRERYIEAAYDPEDAVDQEVLVDDALFSVQDLRLFWQQATGERPLS